MSVSDLLILRISSTKPSRLDQLVLEALRAREPRTPVSRGLLKKFLRKSPPLLDGEKSASASSELEGRHTITLTGWNEFLAHASHLIPAETCFLPILYEDEDLLILNKSSGVPSVALSGDENHTAVAAALARVPTLAQIPGAKPLEPGLLHRLDTGTSGILVFAKSAEELARLRTLWKTQAVRKFYQAVVEPANGAARPQTCTLRNPIAHSAASSARMVVLPTKSAPPLRGVPAIRGKPLEAVTHILGVTPLPEQLFELEIEIETGVMHQIRAHLASQGWPIVGDRTYNPRAKTHAEPDARLMLHAGRMELPLRGGAVLEIRAK